MLAFGHKLLPLQHRRNYARMRDTFVIMYKDSNFIPSRVDVLSYIYMHKLSARFANHFNKWKHLQDLDSFPKKKCVHVKRENRSENI